MSKLNHFAGQMASIKNVLEPREVKGKKVTQPIYTRQVVTIVGVKTAKSRFLPVSHEGHGIETYIDKVELLGKTRAEFIAGTRFPFITIIESPTLLDVAGYLWAVRRADEHGYGKYSANHGKFDTEFLAVSTGYPRFSVLDMLEWMEDGDLKACFQLDNPQVTFDSIQGVTTLYGEEVEGIAARLQEEFDAYLAAL